MENSSQLVFYPCIVMKRMYYYELQTYYYCFSFLVALITLYLQNSENLLNMENGVCKDSRIVPIPLFSINLKKKKVLIFLKESQ